jgi:hypothetical protein
MKILTAVTTAVYMMYTVNRRNRKRIILLNPLVRLPTFSFISTTMLHAHVTQLRLCKYRCKYVAQVSVINNDSILGTCNHYQASCGVCSESNNSMTEISS